ncbi:MAG: DUF2384 domain-containing protein [Gammaproteobacteria bacterium]|nr:DUF2384 domain-containing protein [Gammaproteobacteria bacterium]
MLSLREVGKNLGLRTTIRNSMTLVEKTRQGLQPTTFSKMARNLEVDEKTLSAIVSISERTVSRAKKDHKLLPPPISGKLIEIAKVLTLATEVFEERDSAIAWLKDDCLALGNVTPLSLLDTPQGNEIVIDELYAIEYGNFA